MTPGQRMKQAYIKAAQAAKDLGVALAQLQYDPKDHSYKKVAEKSNKWPTRVA